MSLKLSILDQSPVNDTETAAEGFQHTIELAAKAEQWGYHRYWVTEHHGSSRVMGSSPEVLISHLLAKTERIRVGSGGVMLQHYSPFKVAENFNVLSSLAPGRVDLGIGRGPGGQPQSTKALQQEIGGSVTPFAEKLVQLGQFLHNELDETHPLYGLQTTPMPPKTADVYLLGTTPASAAMAADLGMPYVFALFLNQDEAIMTEAVDTYRRRFVATQSTQPTPILALPVVAADTAEEAEMLSDDVKMVRIRLESGRTFSLGTIEAAEEFGRQSKEDYTIELPETGVIYGTLQTVRKKLLDIQSLYHIDELFIVTNVKNFQKRLHSYELLRDLLTPATVPC